MLDTIKPRFAADFNSSHNLCCKELSVDEVMVVVSVDILSGLKAEDSDLGRYAALSVGSCFNAGA